MCCGQRRGSRPAGRHDQLRDRDRDLRTHRSLDGRFALSADGRIAILRDAFRGEQAWLVGGALRDEALGLEPTDFDIAVLGDAQAHAQRVADAVPAAVFPLSDEFGGWRVVPHSGGWQVDVTPLAGGAIEDDLAARDFTVNAIARPLSGGEDVDPHDGRGDLDRGVLRAVGERSFSADPLRVVRLARFASLHGLTPEGATVALAREAADGLRGVAGERILSEFLQLISAVDPVAAIELLDRTGGLRVILPEVDEVDGVEQSSYHHLDVWQHTLEVLARTVELEADPEQMGPAGVAAAGLLRDGIADGASRWTAVRIGALLHDIAKGRTRVVFAGGRIGFPGHDELGAEMTSTILRRLRASTKLTERVAAITRHHLDAGFMTHRSPIGPYDVHGYLVATGPAAIEVTVVSAADRLATRGRKSEIAIPKHLDVTSELLAAAVETEHSGLPRSPIRGDELAAELGIEQGPELGRLIAGIEAAVYAGDVASRSDAIARARELRDSQ